MSIRALQQVIDNAENIVFFGGAGVSTESGIPDFRSVDGLYNQQYRYPPEKILSHSFFETHTGEFFDFYRKKMICLDAQPNAAHLKLAELESKGKIKAVVTQNIDGLHQKAGSKNVLELHGSVHRNFCRQCGKPYTALYMMACEGIPRCDCGGVIKPDVVLYEETLDDEVMQGAILAISKADVLIVGGTSLAVYPAAGLLNYFGDGELVLINKSPTPYDRRASMVLNASIGETLARMTV